jgi:uncharacterized protein (DUF2267 family)
MEREEFVGRARVQLGAKNEVEAARTVDAYLEILAERLAGFGPHGLSEKLPWLRAYAAFRGWNLDVRHKPILRFRPSGST